MGRTDVDPKRLSRPVKQSLTLPGWLDVELGDEANRTGKSKQSILCEQIAKRYPEARRRHEGSKAD